MQPQVFEHRGLVTISLLASPGEEVTGEGVSRAVKRSTTMWVQQKLPEGGVYFAALRRSIQQQGHGSVQTRRAGNC